MKCIKILSSPKKYLARKYVFNINGKSVESTYVNRKNKNIICISCMFGCPVRCKFCASGRTYYGNLRSKEIILIIEYILKKEVKNDKRILISFMGSGEPLLNLDEVLKSIDYFKRKLNNVYFTISLSGTKIKNITKLIEFNKKLQIPIKLQLSLHSPYDSERINLIPTTDKMGDILKMLNKYQNMTGNSIELNYILLDNVNDSINHAKSLVKLIKRYKFNLKINEYHDIGQGFKESTNKNKFIKTLNKLSIFPEVYFTDGKDISAACGQLVSQSLK